MSVSQNGREKAQRLLSRLGCNAEAEPLRRTFEQVAELLANGVRVFQESGEKKRLGAVNCPWSVEWRRLGENAQSKVIGTREEAERFAAVKRRKKNFLQLSLDMGRNEGYLSRCIQVHGDLWKEEARKAGLPDVWGPEFSRVKLHARFALVRAAHIHASGVAIAPTGRRIGFYPPALQQLIKPHSQLWGDLVAKAKDYLGIEPGHLQKARLTDLNGKALRTTNNHTHPPVWDRRKGELRIRARIARKVDTKRAKNVAYILDGFEELGWPASIDDPLVPNGKVDQVTRLQETVRTLNRGLKYMRFHTENGDSIFWQASKRED